MRVLIVEDDASIGELCRVVLEDEGYACMLAQDLSSARASIAERAIDLLVADVVLADGGNGRDLTEEMKTAGVPVIFMSGDFRALREMTEGRISHLQKPFRVPELVARVHAALSQPPVPGSA
jgi:two-component system response regulator ResD